MHASARCPIPQRLNQPAEQVVARHPGLPGQLVESLVNERSRIINRMKSALARLGIRDLSHTCARRQSVNRTLVLPNILRLLPFAMLLAIIPWPIIDTSLHPIDMSKSYLTLSLYRRAVRPEIVQRRRRKRFLPEDRAVSCEREYAQLSYAFDSLIGPHIDRALAQKLHKRWLPPITAKPKPWRAGNESSNPSR